jgi:hypothetical protein
VKAAKTRALKKRTAHKPPVHSAHKRKPAAKAKKARKAPVHRSAAAVKAAHARALSPGAVSCCSALALTTSLRLAGWPAGAEDVLDLYRLTADSPDAGASIVATLDAAFVFGLAGVRPVSFEAVNFEEGVVDAQIHGSARGALQQWRFTPGLILGLNMPEGRHAVTADPSGGVWSWGGLYDLTAEAVIEEAWLVTWPRRAVTCA